jgi:hypothetical protein
MIVLLRLWWGIRGFFLKDLPPVLLPLRSGENLNWLLGQGSSFSLTTAAGWHYESGILFLQEPSYYWRSSVWASSDPHAVLLPGTTVTNGSEVPKLSSGEFILVWREGTWVMRGPWVKTAKRIVGELQKQIEVKWALDLRVNLQAYEERVAKERAVLNGTWRE